MALEGGGLQGNQHIVFVMTDPKYRKLGIGKKLLEMANEYTENYLIEENKKKGREIDKSVKFSRSCEQNDPLLMTMAAYLKDSKNASLDQVTRLNEVWQNGLGFRRVGREFLDYAQPALEEGADPCLSLSWNMNLFRGGQVTPDFLKGIITRFFAFSCLKGGDPKNDPIYRKIIEQLDGLKTSGVTSVNLSDDREELEELKKSIVKLFNDPELQKDKNWKDIEIGTRIPGFIKFRKPLFSGSDAVFQPDLS